MHKEADIAFSNNTFHLSGALDFSNVMSLYAKSLPQLITSPELHFDFANVTSSDSSGLALMIEWAKYAKEKVKPIRFSHLSEDLLAIAKAANLDHLIAPTL